MKPSATQITGAVLFTAAVLVLGYTVIPYYLAWTFFTSMGVIELAHFIFPFFTPEPYGYFPGMVTVVPLAPVAWFGMWRLLSQRSDATSP